MWSPSTAAVWARATHPNELPVGVEDGAPAALQAGVRGQREEARADPGDPRKVLHLQVLAHLAGGRSRASDNNPVGGGGRPEKEIKQAYSCVWPLPTHKKNTSKST